MHYKQIIAWSESDQSFVVEVPELPGCMADGATYEEAVANAQIVIEEWLETARSLGRSIPEPSGQAQGLATRNAVSKTRFRKKKQRPHRYFSDRPITELPEDQLGRAPFALRLAEDITAWGGKDSLVIGLYGDWGSGRHRLRI